jgi:hypothetical protein
MINNNLRNLLFYKYSNIKVIILKFSDEKKIRKLCSTELYFINNNLFLDRTLVYNSNITIFI